jgi:serine/threonine-protein kinase RsbT
MMMAQPTQAKAAVIRSDLDIVIARTLARDTAKALGFGAIDQARIATAVSELARNIFLYAGTGSVTVREIEHGGRKGIEIVCEDEGPGISDVELAMSDGYTTSRGMGMGLPGARRLMDEFEIHTQSGIGTTITCRKWRA